MKGKRYYMAVCGNEDRSHGWPSQECKKNLNDLASWEQQEKWHSLTSWCEHCLSLHTRGHPSTHTVSSSHDRGIRNTYHLYYDSACLSLLMSAVCVFSSTLQPLPMQSKSPEKQLGPGHHRRSQWLHIDGSPQWDKFLPLISSAVGKHVAGHMVPP